MSGCWPVPLVGRKTAEGEIESATIKERHSDAEKVKRMLKPSMSFQNLGMTEISNAYWSYSIFAFSVAYSALFE